MLKIGEIEKITKVPSKTLRYWEEFGLLTPAYIDKYTGYRGYDQNNIERISQIVYLKNLGFSLKEIKNFSEEVINQKTKELKEKLNIINKNISTLSSLKKSNKGEVIMKNFVNDPEAIGKWSLLGLAETEEDAKTGKYKENNDYIIKDLYLMEGGLEYWVLGWTKGFIFISNRKNPYTIYNDKMIVSITFENQPVFYAVYKKMDNLNHKIEEFRTYDNINIPFKSNNKMIGFWESVCIVDKIADYYPNKKSEWELFVKKLAISPDGSVIFTLNNNDIYNNKWSNNLIINEIAKTAAKCTFKVLNGEAYMFMEWKSGDYIYGGKVQCYYVFKKQK